MEGWAHLADQRRWLLQPISQRRLLLPEQRLYRHAVRFGAGYGIAEPADGLPVQLPIVQSFLPAAPNDSVYLVDATLPPLSGSALNSRLDLTSGHCVSGSQSYPATALKPGGKVPPSEAGPISLR